MIILYSHGSPNGHRASIMFEETGLKYELRPVDIKAGGAKSPEFLAIYPAGKIPVIVDDSVSPKVVLGETLAIALYLAEKSGRLMPQDIQARARAWYWGSVFGGEFQAAFRIYFFGRTFEQPARDRLLEKGLGDAQRYFVTMDAALADGPYLAGEMFSFADVMAAPIVLTTVPNLGIDLSVYPNILKWRDLIAARPGVQRGMAASH